MATLAAAAITAGVTAYGISQAGSAARRANATSRDMAERSELMQLLNMLDNRRLTDADSSRADRQYEDTLLQRALLNQRNVAGQQTAEGQRLFYDPSTNTWRVQNAGVSAIDADRAAASRGAEYARATELNQAEGGRDRVRRETAGTLRGNEAALAQALMRQYEAAQPRSRSSLRGDLVASGVANTMDPIRDVEANAAAQAVRQGSNAAPVLMQLARQGRAGTQAAIADARMRSPMASMAEGIERNRTILEPYATMAGRATQGGDSFVPFSSAGSSGMLQGVPRGAADASGSNLYRSNPTPSISARPYTPVNQVDEGSRIASYLQTGNNLFNAVLRANQTRSAPASRDMNFGLAPTGANAMQWNNGNNWNTTDYQM